MSIRFDCGICLEFDSDASSEDYFLTTECGHIFHYKCINRSYSGGFKICPSCKKATNPSNWTKLCGIYAAKIKQKEIRPKFVQTEKYNYDFTFKIIIIGSSNVGKTSLAQRYADESFELNGPATTGVDCFFKSIRVGNLQIFLSIWDTTGQERFRSITRNFYRDVHGALLVYDVTNPDSFYEINTWKADLATYAPETVSTVLIGNKTDLRERCLEGIFEGMREKVVSKDSGNALALKWKIGFFETSAKEADNVDIAFRTLAAKIIETNSLVNSSTNFRLRQTSKNEPSSCC